MDATAAATLFAWLDREVWLVTAQAGGRRGGLIATFVNQATIVTDLPRLLVGLAKQHHTWELIEQSGAFAVHLLGQDSLDTIKHFGLQSGRNVDKFAAINSSIAYTGSPILDVGVGWLDCEVETRMHTGDRTIFMGQVVDSNVTHYGAPLTLKQLMQIAPPEILGELKKQVHRDGQLDAQAIRIWREQHGIEPKGQQL